MMQNVGGACAKSVGNSFDENSPISKTVPDVVGLSLADATLSIEAAGLTLGSVAGSVDPVASQDPTDGTRVTSGTPVDLTMSAP